MTNANLLAERFGLDGQVVIITGHLLRADGGFTIS